MIRKLLFLLLVFALQPIQAQIVINEYSASNLNGFTDGFGRTEDWIELYNTSNMDMDIGGWHLTDKETKPMKWVIPQGTIIDGNGFLLFHCSGRDLDMNGEYHTNFKLAQTTGKDKVILTDPIGTVIDLQEMKITQVEHSNCRATNGDATWMTCTAPTPGTSNNGSEQYTGYTARPSMDLPAGYHTGNQLITLTNNESNSVLRYTTNGTNPTSTSSIYASPIAISSTTVIKARAYSNDADVLPGLIEFNTYFIDEDYELAVFSVAADQVIELANGNGPLIPIGSIEYFNIDKERETTSFGSLNRHGQDSWVLDHRSLDWISRDEMGYSKAVNAPIFSYSDRDEYQKFMFRNSGDDNYPAINDGNHEGSTHIRDEYVQTLSLEGGMELDTRAVERVHLFLNGQYWGLYGMRERPVDHDYTGYYYDQGKYDVQYLSTWGSTEIEYGGNKAQAEWINLRNYILENDMSDEASYQVAEDSLNMLSLIDYMVANLTVVASDWLNYNTGWWRGLDPEGDHKKWGYILWDLDATFDYYINYSGVPNISPDADPCDLEIISDFMDGFFGNGNTGGEPPQEPDTCPSIINGQSPYEATDTIFIQTITQDPWCCTNGWDDICQTIYDDIAAGGNPGAANGDVGKHEKIFLKLLEENATFKQLYYSRYADLMNTVYKCDNMISTLDRMLDVIRPEMPKQIARWGGTMAEWEQNVVELKEFIEERCTLLDDGMIDCYNELDGPYNVYLRTEPDGIGEIDFNTLDIETFPWEGEYFSGMENKIKAKVFDAFEPNYAFSHWESSMGHVIFPDETSRRATLTITGPDTLTAVFSPISSTQEISLLQDTRIYPNPTNDQLTVGYTLTKNASMEFSLYSTLGNEVANFVEHNNRYGAGKYKQELSLQNLGLSTGMYLLQIRVDDQVKSYKIHFISDKGE